MNNKNYTNYSKPKINNRSDAIKKPVAKEVEHEETKTSVAEDAKAPIVEKHIKVEPKFGCVNVGRLNIRKYPSSESEILMVVESGARLSIIKESNDDWFSIEAENGLKGFCMKQFVNV